MTHFSMYLMRFKQVGRLFSHNVPHATACAYYALSLGKGGNANGIQWDSDCSSGHSFAYRNGNRILN